MDPTIVSAAQGVLEFDIGRECGVEKSGIDDLRFDAELVESRILASMSVNSWLPMEKGFSRAWREVVGVPNSDSPFPEVRGTTAPSISQKEFCPRRAD